MDQKCTDRQVWGPIQQNWPKIFTLPESRLLTLTITFWPIRPRSIITWLVIVTGTIWNRFFRYCLFCIEFKYAFDFMSFERISNFDYMTRVTWVMWIELFRIIYSIKSGDPWPLINCFEILKSKCSIFETNRLRNF